MEIRGRFETTQSTTLLKSLRILRRVLETRGNLLPLRYSWKAICKGRFEKFAGIKTSIEKTNKQAIIKLTKKQKQRRRKKTHKQIGEYEVMLIIAWSQGTFSKKPEKRLPKLKIRGTLETPDHIKVKIGNTEVSPGEHKICFCFVFFEMD